MVRLMRSATAISTLVLFASGHAFSDDVLMTRLERCQAAYQEFLALPDKCIQAQIEWWGSQEPICSGTGLYEYFMGKLYLRAKEYEAATKAFETGVGLNSEYQKELELALGDVKLGQKSREEALEIYRRVAQKYPDWSQGYHAVGLVLWMQGHLEKAVASLNRAVNLNETAATFRILTMAYYSNGDYAKSIEALNYAYSLDSSIAGDRDPMIAAIRSYTELGQYDMARNFLAILLNAQPSMREDKEFLKAGFYLREKMQADAESN